MRTTRSVISRRRFLSRAAGTAATFSLVPSYVAGLHGATSPNNKLHIACIGVGGRGADDINELNSENLVAFCDVDSKQAAATFKKYPQAKQYQDFRRMLDEVGKQIDAVMVATPDHTHAVAVMRAIKMGKHVYCEKPLAHSIHEVRTIVHAARKYKVATQLGNQGHSFPSIRQFCEWIWDDAIGPVREVHARCRSIYSQIRNLDRVTETPAVPATLNWDLWLGPAQYRPYNPRYVPGTWRSWMPFGTGVIGDWTCHVVDPVFWALNLDAPTHIEAETGNYDPEKHGDTFPTGSIIRYDFPARGQRPAVKLVWYDGDQAPPRPDEMDPKQKFPDTGAVVIGDKGKIVYGSHGAAGLRIIPDAKMQEYKQPAEKIPRSPGHHREWIDACKGGKPAGSNFNYGGSLVEVALLGIIAMRLKNQKLEWNGAKGKFTNSKAANQLLATPYRQRWSL